MNCNMKSGIYKITNIKNGKFYIGSSVNLSGRIARHKRELRTNKHNNNKLQRAWDKYSAECFIFSVIEYVERDKLLEVEQRYLDKYLEECPDSLYNVAKNTTAPMMGITSPNKNKKFNKETRIKMSLSHKGKPSPNKGNKFSKEVRMKMSQDRKGNGAGEKNPQAKINKKIVDKIRALYLTGDYFHKDIAKICGVSRVQVTNIVNNKRWYCDKYEKIKPAK